MHDESIRLCLCGCGLPTKGPKGVRPGHNQRLRVPALPMLRFWKHVDYGGPGCWFWTGGLTLGGYGVFVFDDRCSGGKNTRTTAHRWIYTALHGPLDKTLFACHTCDVNYPPGDRNYRRCVRPSHLVADTQDRNMQHARESGRMCRGEQKSDLTAAEVTEIRRRWANRRAGHETQSSIAADFWIARGTVSDIVTRKNWKHVP